jgi:hypothetical protein
MLKNFFPAKVKAAEPLPGGEAPAFRMSLSTFEEMSKSFSPPRVDKNTTELEAGYKLGVADVLAEFRRKFVVEG